MKSGAGYRSGAALRDELNKASRVHYSFLPEPISDDRIDLSIRHRPAHILGGDYCSAFWVTDWRLAVCMCDVVGHGLASALYAARVNTYVLTHARMVSHPCELIAGLNRFLHEKLADVGIYTTFFTAFIDLDAMRLEYMNAAHPPAICYSAADDTCRLLQPITTLLGFATDAELARRTRSLTIRSGDRLVVYTDGLIEWPESPGFARGVEHLQTFSRRHAHRNSSDFCDALLRFTDQEFGQAHDDQLVLTLTIR